MSDVSDLSHLPNLLILGAQKSGTTSLHQLLARHPDVSMTVPKELRVLAWPDWRERLARYDGQFSTSAAIRGEGTPAYLHDPLGSIKLAELGIPDLRAICILRHPTDRAYSQYWHATRDGRESKCFASALAAEPVRIRRSFDDWRRYSYVTRGFYDAYLSPFAEMLRERLLVIGFSDLVRDPSSTMDRVYRFLELDPERSPEFVPLRANPARLPRSRRLAYAVHRIDRSKAQLAVRVVRKLNVREASYEPMPGALRAQLDQHYGPVVSAVRERFGVDLDAGRRRSHDAPSSEPLADRSSIWWPDPGQI